MSNENEELVAQLMQESVNSCIADELLDESDATQEEREAIKKMVTETQNPWDVPQLLSLIRLARQQV